MPYVVPLVAGALIWNSMLALDGWVNKFLQIFGIDVATAWISDPDLVYPGLVIIGIWGIGGAVIINLAGLRGIPTELYDAAKIDGAGAWGQLRYVTIPLMTPVIFYSLILGIVGVLQYFLVPLVLTNGTGDRRQDALLQPLPLPAVLHFPEPVVRCDAGLDPVPLTLA